MRVVGSLVLAAFLVSCSQDNGAFAEPVEIAPATNSELQEYARLVQASLDRDERVLFVCGPWMGKSRFLKPTETGWVDDGVSKGRVAIVGTGASVTDIVYRDALGSTNTVVRDGGELKEVGEKSERRLTVSVAFPMTGNAEIYAVVTGESGEAKLLNSTVKVSGLSTRISSFESDCISG